MRNGRRSRNYRNSRRNKTKLTFTPVIVILCLSVGCGYAAAKYVVDPVVNHAPQLLSEESAEETEATDEAVETEATQEKEATDKKVEDEKAENSTTKIVEDDVNVEETGKIEGYALQFGCYSGKSAAETAMEQIDVTGLQILEQDDMYKIVGKTYDTKEKAAAALKELPDTVKAFVTTIYK